MDSDQNFLGLKKKEKIRITSSEITKTFIKLSKKETFRLRAR